MKLLSKIFDFMFAPAGAFDPESSFSAASNGSTFGQVDATIFNPATGFPMIDGTGVDVGGNVFGIDVHYHDYGNCG